MKPGSSRYLYVRNESTTPARQTIIIQLVNFSPGHPSFKKEGKFICAKSDLVYPKNNS
jgi:hypothetical protein